jgi:hypothetical protein
LTAPFRNTLGIRLAAGFVLTATAWVVRVVDQNVVVARGADDTVYCLAELLVSGAGRMFFASLFSADRHSLAPAMNSPVQS